MTDHIVIGSILCLPLILGLLFKVSTSHLFFSIMAGELLGRYFGHDLDLLISDISKNSLTQGFGDAALIILPMLATSLLLRNTIVKGRLLLHVIPLLITGIIFAAFLLPVLPSQVQSHISTSFIGNHILELNKMIIGVMIVIQLISLWLFSRKSHKK